MSKAILVMEMPKSCGECPICQGIAMDGDFVCSIRDEDGNEQGFYEGEYERANYCPLREVPQKITSWKGKSTNYQQGHRDGYNAAIDEILGKDV